MPVNITYLVVPCDAEDYARRFGAQRDSSGYWFVAGEVPRELLNFLPKEVNRRFNEVTPKCPICGGVMRKRISKFGNSYWQCFTRSRTGCSGFLRYEDYLESVAPGAVVGDFLPKIGSLLLSAPTEDTTPPSPPKSKEPHPLRERWLAIIVKAFDVFAYDQKRVLLWLEQPKCGLGGKAPIHVLGTQEECDSVARLLDEFAKVIHQPYS